MSTPAEPQAGDPGLDPALADLRASVADMRATARWITGAAAGVGALVLAGGPLVIVKDLDDAGDVVAAAGGMLLAVSGVVWVVWRASEVLTPRTATLDDLGGWFRGPGDPKERDGLHQTLVSFIPDLAGAPIATDTCAVTATTISFVLMTAMLRHQSKKLTGLDGSVMRLLGMRDRTAYAPAE